MKQLNLFCILNRAGFNLTVSSSILLSNWEDKTLHPCRISRKHITLQYTANDFLTFVLYRWKWTELVTHRNVHCCKGCQGGMLRREWLSAKEGHSNYASQFKYTVLCMHILIHLYMYMCIHIHFHCVHVKKNTGWYSHFQFTLPKQHMIDQEHLTSNFYNLQKGPMLMTCLCSEVNI